MWGRQSVPEPEPEKNMKKKKQKPVHSISETGTYTFIKKILPYKGPWTALDRRTDGPYRITPDGTESYYLYDESLFFRNDNAVVLIRPNGEVQVSTKVELVREPCGMDRIVPKRRKNQ